MTDSVERKAAPSITEEIKSELKQYDRPERTEFSDLPTWVRTACAMKYVLGMTWKEVANRVGKSPGTVDAYKKSPAFKRWRAELQEASEDPKTMAEYALKASAMGVTMEYLAAFQKAIEASDYEATAKMSKDLLDRIGISKKSEKQSTQPQLHITIAGGSVETPVIEAEWEEIDDGDG